MVSLLRGWKTPLRANAVYFFDVARFDNPDTSSVRAIVGATQGSVNQNAVLTMQPTRPGLGVPMCEADIPLLTGQPPRDNRWRIPSGDHF